MASKQYGLIRTIQVRNENVPGVLGALATAIGQVEANIGNIVTVHITQNHVIRDIDVLEARDVMQVLNNDPGAPADLRQKALHLAGRIIEFDPDVRGGHGFAIARDILESGRALERMQAIIEAQGRRAGPRQPGRSSFEVKAPKSGEITAIDNFHLARVARLAGAPMSKGAGVDLLKKMGDRVERGEPLYRVHAEFEADYEFALERCARDTGYRIDRT
jgi:thymidine phosphorylase